MDVRMERGTLDGKFGSLIVSAGNLAEDEEATADAIWAHMKNGTNGIRWTQAIAAGSLTGMYVTISTSDSLDALMAASNQMFAGPAILGMMTELNFRHIQRSLFRILA